MHDRTRTGNRRGIALVGLVLLLVGLVLLGANRGIVLRTAPHRRAYPDDAVRFVRDNHTWLWPVVGAVAVVIGLLFLRWLLVQARVDRLRTVMIDSDAATESGAGRTTLPAGVIADVVEDDLLTVDGVRRVRASLTGTRDDPQLWLHIVTDSDADLARVRRHLDETALVGARTALDRPDLTATIRIDVKRRLGANDSGR